ncbi:MAG: hypothetical protein PHI48_09790 [Bacteroidales bacterium]|nr:hypothetical protein [Bacteroidales bacterium]
MKKITLLLIALLATVAVSAQVPSAFNFQAVLRDVKGDVLKNADVWLSVSLLEDNATTLYYQESIYTQSDSMGVISISINNGTYGTSINDAIVRTKGSLWMELIASYEYGKDEDGDGEMEHFQGIIRFPSQQLVSVPYSMMSGNVMLTSPNGNKYTLKVDDDGNLSTSLINGVDSTSNIIPSREYIVMDDFGLDSKVTIHKFKGVIRTQQEYETLLGKVPNSKVDFTKYSLVLFVESVVLKDFYLEKISETQYKFKRVPTSGGVVDDVAYGLLIPKIDESVTIDFTVEWPPR